MAMPLEERQAHRLQYLRAVYEASDGVAGRFIKFTDIGEELGFDKKHSDEIADYLASEGLLNWAAMGVIELTHWGLKEVEQALSSPDQPTEHFPALVIAQNYMQVGSITNSQVQQGTSGSTQLLTSAEQDDVRKLTSELRAALGELDLDTETTAEVQADLAVIDAQLTSPRPKANIIREALSSTRAVLEGAAASGLATAAPQIPGLIEHLGHVIGSL